MRGQKGFQLRGEAGTAAAIETGADEATVQNVPAVRLFIDVLDKAKAQAAFSLATRRDHEAVAASKGCLVIDFGADEDEVVPLLMKVGEAEAEALQVLVAGVFEVVQVHGIVDDALEVAFVVADFQGEFKVRRVCWHVRRQRNE